MGKIGIFSFARKQSKRCPNKSLRPFGGTTLTDIVLGKLTQFGEDAFFAGYEKEFEDKCQEAGVRFVKRNERSINIDGPITEIFDFLRDQDYEYFLLISACAPFVKTSTIKAFIEDRKKNDFKPALCDITRHRYYLTKDRRHLNFPEDLKTFNTKVVEPVSEILDALYFFNKKYFFENGRYGDFKEIDLFEIMHKIEVFDIDTEEDFKIAEYIWKGHVVDKYAL